MTSDKLKAACELVAILATEPNGGHRGAHLIAQDAIDLIKLGRRASNLAVRACNGEGRNGPWSDDDEARHDAAMQRIARKAGSIAAHYNARVHVGGDPRGYVLKLQLESRCGNTMGNDGWGVA